MSTPNDDGEKITLTQRSRLELHVQTILATITAAALIAGVNYMFNDNREKGELQSQIKTISEQFVDMRAEIREIRLLVGNQVRRDEFEKLERRVIELERATRQPR